jgi:membrane associated rhomboid family serine protease
MRSAAVGFQCPNCVKEGAKSVRTAKLPYGGEPSANPALTSLVLIGINLAVWILILAAGGSSSDLFNKLALLPQSQTFRDATGGLIAVKGVSGGAWWQVVTSMFTHVAVWHIGANMLALYILGPHLESILGRARFLAVYLVSGLVGSAAVMFLASQYTQTLGASGAIFGVMGAMLVIALKIRINVQPVVSLIGLNVLFTVVGSSFISWQGHLGGLVGGSLLTAILVYSPKGNARALIQWAGLAAVGIAACALIVVRAAALS